MANAVMYLADPAVFSGMQAEIHQILNGEPVCDLRKEGNIFESFEQQG